MNKEDKCEICNYLFYFFMSLKSAFEMKTCVKNKWHMVPNVFVGFIFVFLFVFILEA